MLHTRSIQLASPSAVAKLRAKTALVCAVFAASFLGVGAAAHATVINDHFEPGSYSWYTSGSGSVSQTTDFAHSQTHSIELGIQGSGAATVEWGVSPGQVQLGGAVGSYWAYLPSTSSNTDWVPYVMYWVDTDRNGAISTIGDGGDSLVIAFYGVDYKKNNTVTDEWMQWGIFADTNVHVVGARDGLGDDEFTTSGNPGPGLNGDTFGDLAGMATGPSGSWGDLDILGMRLQANSNSSAGFDDYHVYVDDVKLVGRATSVPEPSPFAMLLLGLGGLMLLGWRTRQFDLR